MNKNITRFNKIDFIYIQLIQLNYQDYGASFIIVLPDEIDGINELQEKLKDASIFEAAVQSMYTHKVEVHIPKFKIETKIDLKSVLQKVSIYLDFLPF
jgi:serpin B